MHFQSWKNLRIGITSRIVRAGLGLVSLTALAACLQTNTAQDPAPAATIEDPGPYAGSTSSTNWEWPQGSFDYITWHCDSNLVLRAKDNLVNGNVIPLAGTLLLFRTEDIPALEGPQPFSRSLVRDDSVVIPRAWIDSLRVDKDTVSFNIQIFPGGTTQYFINGFAYIKHSRQFIGNALPVAAPDFFEITRDPGAYFKGSRSFSLPPPKGKGKSQMSYYIPGSPFYWNTDLDSIVDLGPMAHGQYPLRLLRVTELGEGQTGSQVEIFEIKSDSTGDFVPFHLGETLLDMTTTGSVSLK